MFQRTLFTLILVSSSVSFATNPEIDRGRYLVRTMSCNDCHTPGYAMKAGQVPEKDWLIGSDIGYLGPWGTTYASNLRRIASSMDRKTWFAYLKNLKARPPMPSYELNIIEKKDADAIYAFLKHLGDSSNPVPAALPPGVNPKTMYFNFNVVQPN